MLSVSRQVFKHEVCVDRGENDISSDPQPDCWELLTFKSPSHFSSIQGTPLSPVMTELRWLTDIFYTYHRSVDEVLRLTAFLLPVDDVEVDFGRVGNGPVSIRRDLNKQHVLDRDGDTTEKQVMLITLQTNCQVETERRRLPLSFVCFRSKLVSKIKVSKYDTCSSLLK